MLDPVLIAIGCYDTNKLGIPGEDAPESPGQSNNPNRVGPLLNSYRKHGMVAIDWLPEDPEIHLQIWDGRSLFLEPVVRLSELQPG